MAEENKNDVMTVLKTPISLLVLIIFLAIYFIAFQFIPKVSEFSSKHSEYKTQMQLYADKEKTLEQLKAANAQKVQADAAAADTSGMDKELFKPLESGMDPENVLASEFNEILSLITMNTIKTRSVQYSYDPADDNFVKGAASKYSVCKLDMQMIATYTNFKNFMQELYKHEHYLDIAKIEIIPYNKNKTILLINLQLKLYAERA